MDSCCFLSASVVKILLHLLHLKCADVLSNGTLSLYTRYPPIAELQNGNELLDHWPGCAFSGDLPVDRHDIDFDLVPPAVF